MAQPLRNPFYVALLMVAGLLLFTMFVYLVGWFYVPDPNRPTPATPLPPLLRWVDRNAILLIAGEVLALIVLSILSITLDRRFEPPLSQDKEPKS